MESLERAVALLVLLAASAHAECSVPGTTTVSESLPDFATTCSYTFTGDIAVATSFSGSVDLGGLSRIDGVVSAKGAQELLEVKLPDIEYFKGLEMSDLDQWYTYDFGSLSDPWNYIHVETILLSNLRDLDMFVGYAIEGLTEVTAMNNSAMEWFNLTRLQGGTGADTLTISHNFALKGSYMEITSTEGSLVIEDNGLEQLALPLLKSVGGNLTIKDNAYLTDLSMSSIVSVGSNIIISGNGPLNLAWEALQTIGGDLVFEGNVDFNFTNLQHVGGNITFTSPYQANCDSVDFGEWTITCNSQIKPPATSASGGLYATTSPMSTSSSGSSSGLSSGAKIGIGVGVAGGVIGLAGIMAVVLLVLRRRKKNAANVPAEQGTQPPETKLSPAYSDTAWQRDHKNSNQGYGEPMLAAGVPPNTTYYPNNRHTLELEGDHSQYEQRSAELESPASPQQMPGDERFQR